MEVRKHSGFTLIELLISMTILMLLMALASWSYQQFSRGWGGRLGKMDVELSQYKRWSFVRDAMLCIRPYVVKDDSNNLSFYFLGREQGMTAVTSCSVSKPGSLAVFRLFSEPEKDGRFQLVYEEASLGNTLLTRPDQNLHFNFRMVVQKEFDTLSFSYFGWDNLQAKVRASDEMAANRPERHWQSNFDSLKKKVHPEQIDINLAGFKWVLDVPSDVANTQMSRQSETE